MSFTEKIDVLDLIINTLTEHEERIDKLVTRLEAAVSAVEDRSQYKFIPLGEYLRRRRR